MNTYLSLDCDHRSKLHQQRTISLWLPFTQSCSTSQRYSKWVHTFRLTLLRFSDFDDDGFCCMSLPQANSIFNPERLSSNDLHYKIKWEDWKGAGEGKDGGEKRRTCKESKGYCTWKLKHIISVFRQMHYVCLSMCLILIVIPFISMTLWLHLFYFLKDGLFSTLAQIFYLESWVNWLEYEPWLTYM